MRPDTVERYVQTLPWTPLRRKVKGVTASDEQLEVVAGILAADLAEKAGTPAGGASRRRKEPA